MKNKIDEKVEKNMKELEELASRKHQMPVKDAKDILSRLGKTIAVLSESMLFPLAFPISYLPDDPESIKSAFGVMFATTDANSIERHNLYQRYAIFVEFEDDSKAMGKNAKVIKMEGFLDWVDDEKNTLKIQSKKNEKKSDLLP